MGGEARATALKELATSTHVTWAVLVHLLPLLSRQLPGGRELLLILCLDFSLVHDEFTVIPAQRDKTMGWPACQTEAGGLTNATRTTSERCEGFRKVEHD